MFKYCEKYSYLKMKYITIKKDKQKYYKSFLWKYSKKTFNFIFNQCNIFTQGNIVPITTTLLKQQLNTKYIEPDWSQFYKIDQQITDQYNLTRKQLTKHQLHNLDIIEQIWKDLGYKETNFEKYSDTFIHIIPIKCLQYISEDVNRLISKVNKSFEMILNNESIDKIIKIIEQID